MVQVNESPLSMFEQVQVQFTAANLLQAGQDFQVTISDDCLQLVASHSRQSGNYQ